MTDKTEDHDTKTELYFGSKTAKIGHVEPKAFLVLLLGLMFPRVSTIVISLVILGFLYYLGMKGMTLSDFTRRIQVKLSGRKRTQSTRWKRFF